MIQILKDKTYVKDEENLNTEAFCVFDQNTKLGCCICRFEREYVEILCMEFISEAYKNMFTDGLVRSVLNAADLRGISEGRCANKKIIDSLIKMGFYYDEIAEMAKIEIAYFFNKGCSHDIN